MIDQTSSPIVLQPGDAAPDFALPDQTDTVRRLGEWRGRTLVLFFYPKDLTEGCTREACDFRDATASFDKLDVEIVGVSADPPKRHRKFIEKEALPFTLLSDESLDTLKAYGVWVEKSMYGRRFMGIERTTFVIDPDGRIAEIYRKVRVPGHVEEVLHAIERT